MKFIYFIFGCAVLLSLALTASVGGTLNIVITNDDGFKSILTNKLYKTLKKNGHDVVISAPFKNQSGRGTYYKLHEPTGIGQHKDDMDIYYVKGTPVMAALYGIHVVAPKRWKSGPDLLISGPNAGRNLGIITNHSGTVSAAVIAFQSGVPAIAVSTYYATEYNETLTEEVADYMVKIVAELEENSDGGPVLPEGIGLNISFPMFNKGQGDFLKVRFTQIGTFLPQDGFGKGAQMGWYVKFYEEMKNDPWYAHFASGGELKPGIGFDLDPKWSIVHNPDSEGWWSQSEGELLNYDENRTSIVKITKPGYVTISVIDGNWNAERRIQKQVNKRLKGLIKKVKD